MKVRIGTGPIQTDPKPSEIEAQIVKTIVDQVIENALDLTPRFLRRMEQRLQTVATAEANRIFSTITSIIDRPQRGGAGGFSASDMMSGVEIDPIFKPRALAKGGSVQWQELSYRYALRKHTGPNRDRFFRKSNAMRNYFARQGSTIVRNRLGGVEVKVQQTNIPKPGVGRDVLPEQVAHLVFGRINVTMFPRLTPSLAPMLSTRDWTSSNGGQMERVIFSGTRTADKLLNRANKHRPLVTPVVQFFMLVRIPNAIRRNLQDYLQRTGRRDVD